MEKIVGGLGFIENIKNLVLNMLNMKCLLEFKSKCQVDFWIYEYEVYGRILYWSYKFESDQFRMVDFQVI